MALFTLKTTALVFLIGSVDYPVARDLEIKIARAYKAAGTKVRFVQLPMARRLKLFNAGVIDADLAARSNLSKSYPDVLQVGPPLLPLDLYLICPPDTQCTEQRFQDTSVSVYSSRGSKALLDEDGHIFSLKGLATYVDSPRQLLTLFNQRRVDYFVHVAVSQKIEEAPIQRPYQSFFLGSYNLPHHVHKSHNDMVSSLSTDLSRIFSAQ